MSEETAVAQRRTPPPELMDLKALAIKSSDGEIKMFKTSTHLSIDAGTLIKPMGMNVTICGSEGYKLQCQSNGVQVIMAPTVVVDGQQQSNPHVMTNDQGKVCMVYARAVAFGYTPLGQMAMVDRTVVFDVDTYRNVDLIAKAKKYPQEFIAAPIDYPVNDLGEGRWAKYDIDGAIAVFVNMASTEALTYMSNIQNRLKKAVEIAQTFAVRNASKAHPNIRFHKLEGSGSEIRVNGACWRAVKGEMNFDLSRFNNAVLEIDEMVTTGKTPSGETVTVDAQTQKVHEEAEVVEAEEVAAGEEDQASQPQDELPLGEPEKKEKTAKQKVRDNYIAELVKAADDRGTSDLFEEACERLKIDPGNLDQASDAKIVKLHKEVLGGGK